MRARRGIVHRDIKPENLLIDKAGRVKIADFGIAKIIGESERTEGAEGGDGTMAQGTPDYAAPEQSGGSADHRSDIYSLGVVLYEMLTGERPKGRIEAPSKRVQVDIRIDEIVLRALEKTPDLRFATALEFRTQVEALTSPADRSQRAMPKAESRRGGNRFPKSRWRQVLGLAAVWWFAALPALYWVADIPRTGNSHQNALLLMVMALPLLVLLARGKLRRWQTVENGGRWLKAWSWTGWCLAVPAVGFAAFFVHSVANESGGWHPSSGEALAVALLVVAALTLPGISAMLWHAGGGGKKTFTGTAMVAVAVITVVGLALFGGMTAKPYLARSLGQQRAFKVHFTPEGVTGRVVHVRIFRPDPPFTMEMRMVLEGPDGDKESRLIPRGYSRQPSPDFFVFPRPSPANQPWTDFGTAQQTLVAFVLPTEELAKEAYRRIGSGRLNFDRDKPPGAIHFDPDPRKPETMNCMLFEVTDANGQRFAGSLRLSPELIREGHPRWAEVWSLPTADSLSTLELSWEVRTSPPAAMTLKHRWKDGGSESKGVMSVGDQPAGNTRLYQQRISVLLYKISDTRVGLRLVHGTQPNTKEFEGDFATLADEMRSVSWSGTLKTERDWDIELCRVAGNPVTLRIQDPPPPTVVEEEAKPLGSDDPRWVEITFQGDNKKPPFAIGPQELPGFHRFFWNLRASRPGIVKVIGPHGSPLVAALEKSGDSGLYEAIYAVELVPVDEGSTLVRRVLGPQKDALQIAEPYEELSKRVKESACSTNPARETESMLHRYGPVTSPMVAAIITDQPSETGATDSQTTPIPEDWSQQPPDDVPNMPEVATGIFGKLTDQAGKPIPNRAILLAAKPIPKEEAGLRRALTRADGSFTADLPPSEIYQVFILKGDGSDKSEMPNRSHSAFVGIPRGDRDKGALNLRFDGQKVEAHFEMLLWGVSGQGARGPSAKAEDPEGSPEPSFQIQRIPARKADEMEAQWQITAAKPGWIWLTLGGEKMGQQMLLDPEDGLYRGGVILRLEKSEGHQVGPEIKGRLGYGFAGMSTPWGIKGLDNPFEECEVEFRKQLSGWKAPSARIPRNRELALMTLQGSVVSVTVTDETEAAPAAPAPERVSQPEQSDVFTGKLEDAGGKPIAHRTVSIVLPTQQPGKPPSWSATTQKGGTCPLVLPLGVPFHVILPGEGTRGGPMSNELIIGDRGGPTDQKVERLEGELMIRFDGEKVEAHFRELKASHGKSPSGADAGRQSTLEDEGRVEAIQAAVESIRLGEGILLGDPGKNPPEQTHDPETGLMIFWPPAGGPPGYVETFNTTVRAWHRDQKAAQDEAN